MRLEGGHPTGSPSIDEPAVLLSKIWAKLGCPLILPFMMLISQGVCANTPAWCSRSPGQEK